MLFNPLKPFPYRWFYKPKYFLENLSHGWWNVRHGIRNLWDWAHVVWRLRDWDEHYLYDVMIHQLRLMERGTKYWHVARVDRSRREMQVARALLERLRDGRYDGIMEAFGRGKYQLEWIRTPHKLGQKVERKEHKNDARMAGYKLQEKQREADHELVWRLIKRHVSSWWD